MLLRGEADKHGNYGALLAGIEHICHVYNVIMGFVPSMTCTDYTVSNDLDRRFSTGRFPHVV